MEPCIDSCPFRTEEVEVIDQKDGAPGDFTAVRLCQTFQLSLPFPFVEIDPPAATFCQTGEDLVEVCELPGIQCEEDVSLESTVICFEGDRSVDLGNRECRGLCLQCLAGCANDECADGEGSRCEQECACTAREEGMRHEVMQMRPAGACASVRRARQ